VCENTAQNFPGFGIVPAKGLCSGNASVSMATALTWSMNCASAYIMKQVTPKRFADFLKTLNIQNKIDPYPSLCLGAVDLSMFEMMQGYTMFPNRGFTTKPIFISRIEDKNGNVLESFQTSMKQVISESAAYTMCRMLQGPVDMGTAKGLRARLGALEMGGKTGTTNDNADPGLWALHLSCWLAPGLVATTGLYLKVDWVMADRHHVLSGSLLPESIC
jgi:penicillin-binding protein 1A